MFPVMNRSLPARVIRGSNRSFGSQSAQASSNPGLSTIERKKQTIMKGVGNFSFELTPAFAQKLFIPEAERTEKQEELLTTLRKLGSDGSMTKVYVTKLPGHPQEDTIEACRAVHRFGEHLEAVPHLPTRGIKDENDLQRFIERMTDKNKIDFRPVEHVLVVGGSVDQPVGNFSESLQLLETGILQQNGIKKIGMAAHPQGADNIEQSILEKAFEDKLVWAQREYERTGTTFDWSTQLAYSPQAITQWEQDLRTGNYGKNNEAACNDLPIRLGIPGPASTTQLAKYAQMSGIGNSINYFKKNPLAAWNLLTKRSVLDDLVVEISEYMENNDKQLICGFHFFTFGAITKTLEWACKVKAGEFDVTEAGKITVHG